MAVMIQPGSGLRLTVTDEQVAFWEERGYRLEAVREPARKSPARKAPAKKAPAVKK